MKVKEAKKIKTETNVQIHFITSTQIGIRKIPFLKEVDINQSKNTANP